MSQVPNKDVVAIKDWLAKEPGLPKDFDEMLLKKFLYSCNCSLERTKKCIEDFCMRRRNMPEIFTDRDPLSTKMQDAFALTTVTTYLAGKDELLIHILEEVTDKFDFYHSLKSFMVLADNWVLLERDVLPENHVIVIDIRNYTLSIIPKCNIFYLQKFFTFLLEAMPIRLKEVHVINCPSYYEYLYGLVKSVLPKQVCELIHFHPDHTGLHKFVDKKYLPSEYGGDAESMHEQGKIWVKGAEEKRKFFLNDELWKADNNKKSNKEEVATTMAGSFRTLAID